MTKTYEKIEKVLKIADRPLAPHDFADVIVHVPVPGDGEPLNGKRYVGCSESTLGRRMREMAEYGMLTKKKRVGKTFVEYSLVVKPNIAEFPAEAVAA